MAESNVNHRPHREQTHHFCWASPGCPGCAFMASGIQQPFVGKVGSQNLSNCVGSILFLLIRIRDSFLWEHYLGPSIGGA
eukprot:5362719-Amphidinium_carterae.1